MPSRRALGLVLACALVAWTGAAAAQSFSVEQIVDGFRRTVFGSEYGLFSAPYARRFEAPVTVHVDATTGVRSAGGEVRDFVRWLDAKVPNLDLRLVDDAEQAAFRIHVVDRAAYAETVRGEVFSNPFVTVRGRCMVRSVFTRDGISRSDAVIVADEGEALMRRCMGEEIMQGLGPLNDDRSLTRSMFNDATPFSEVQRFDLLILAMLYDPRIMSGMTPDRAAPLLADVARSALLAVPSSPALRR